MYLIYKISVWMSIMYFQSCRLSGCPPFWHRRQAVLIRSIIECRYQFSGAEWADISDSAKDLVTTGSFSVPLSGSCLHIAPCAYFTAHIHYDIYCTFSFTSWCPFVSYTSYLFPHRLPHLAIYISPYFSSHLHTFRLILLCILVCTKNAPYLFSLDLFVSDLGSYVVAHTTSCLSSYSIFSL